MEDGTIISKTDFAKRRGVTQACISKYIREGTIGAEALVGHGRHARIRADVASAMLRDRLDPAKRGDIAKTGDGSAGSTFLAHRARKEGLQADILALRLAHGRRELQEAADAAAVALAAAVRRAHSVIPGWVEEILAAGQTGGLAAAYALMKKKDDELLNSIADMILAERDDDGG